MTTEKDKIVDTEDSISEVIDRFLHRILDIEECARKFIEIAKENYNENGDRLRNEINSCAEIFEQEENRDNRLLAYRHMRKSIREIERHNNSKPVRVLENSLFISLFSAFDKYIGELISEIYKLNPNLYKNLNREIALSEALTFETMEKLREEILDREIDSLKRKSYIEQFSDLEKRFSIALTKFESWPEFVEISQRRNLITHCDGVVSRQYIDICRGVNFKFKEEPVIGSVLGVGAKYFYRSCNLIAVVGVMLGQTLWRKMRPEDIEEIDSQLNSLIYDFLYIEQWKKSIELSKFALDLPKTSSDKTERMFVVNYSIALKAIGEDSAAKNILERKDWSASSYEFKLAYSVLRNDFSSAKTLMEKIGKESDLLNEMSYHEWPLFREFREQQEFFDGYQNVYGYKYSAKLASLAEEIKARVSASENEQDDF